jgi:hypothetical protein
MPRLGQLVTAIDLFHAELKQKRTRASNEDWHRIARHQLRTARDAARRGRVNDGWKALNCAQQQALHGLSAGEVQSAAAALKHESNSRLVGWMLEAATDNIAIVENELNPSEGAKAHDGRALAQTLLAAALEEQPHPAEGAAQAHHGRPESGRAPAAAYAALITTRGLLDQNSQNMWVRLRLVGERLLVATGLLAALLVGLGFAVAAKVLNDDQLPKVGVLHHFGVYLMIGLLGILGAVLSFALANLGSLEHSATRKIYRLASGRYLTPVARALVGAAAAIVAAIAVQARIVELNEDWLPMIAVAAGFSERLVRRLVDSLSIAAEKPRPSTPGTDKTAPC